MPRLSMISQNAFNMEGGESECSRQSIDQNINNASTLISELHPYTDVTTHSQIIETASTYLKTVKISQMRQELTRMEEESLSAE